MNYNANEDTIFGLSSAPGKAGVSVIRISGSKVKEISKILGCNKPLIHRKASYTTIVSPLTGEVIDKIIMLFFQRPRSFTGEDILELHIHGSRAIINELFAILSDIPAVRLAEAGEFSKRAFYNGKMDLTEAEGLIDLINSETIMQKKVAMRQYSGELQNLYEGWRNSIIHLQAYIEVLIDFPEDEIPLNTRNEIDNKIDVITKEIQHHLDGGKLAAAISKGIYIAIIGETNAGKSSIINALSKSDFAIVSHHEGTTRDVLEVALDLKAYRVTLADTAGIRNTDNAIEQEGISRGMKKSGLADLVIFVVDGSKKIEFSYIQNLSKVYVVINKKDIISPLQLEECFVLLKGLMEKDSSIIGYSVISAKEECDVEQLLGDLISVIDAIYSPSTEPMLTSSRYSHYLNICLKALMQSYVKNNYLEIAAEEARCAANALGCITGRIQLDEILDQVFSAFCIGK